MAGPALGAAVGDHEVRAPGGLRVPGAAEEAAIEQEPGRAGGPLQVVGDRALVDGGRGEHPGADEAAAQVGPEPQAEPVEPLAVGRVAPEAGMHAVRAVPGVGPAHAAGVLDRQGGRVDLLPAVLRDLGQQALAQQLAGAPQPADAPVELALVR